MIGLILISILVVVLLGLFAMRALDHWKDNAEARRLIALQPGDPDIFRPKLVADLPDPARRFFLYAIEEGAPLYTVAQIEMEGRFSLGDKTDPKYMQMRATQVLAAPEGFVWKMTAKFGEFSLSGSDSGRWTRFWLANLLPVARSRTTSDHIRSAFGRYIAEAVFWTPAAVLPGPDVAWTEVSEDVARVTIRHDGVGQSLDITVAENGQPMEISFQRWSDANPMRQYRLQSFGGKLSDFKRFEGFLLPTHIEAGNNYASDEYFPFYIAEVTSVAFPKGAVAGPD